MATGRKLVKAVQNVSRYYSGSGASPGRRTKRAKILRQYRRSKTERRKMRVAVRTVAEKGGFFLGNR